MKRPRRAHLVWMLLVLLALFAKELTLERRVEKPAPASPQGQPAEAPTSSVVLSVIDGDTLKMSDGTVIRLIGVDTPESKHPDFPVEAFAMEATEFTRSMVEGRRVRLEFESLPRDSYGRTLAYVYVGERCLNEELIRRGYGYASTLSDFKQRESYIEAEKEARRAKLGIWGDSAKERRVASRSAGPVVPPADAKEHYGEYITVEGRVISTHNSGKACFLYFAPDKKHDFVVVIFASDFVRFPEEPERYYRGRKVRITGRVKKYRGHPEIILNSTAQIELLQG